MQYEKQTFVNGQVLTAECLNRMEDGIKGACDAVPPACDSTDCSKVLSYGKSGLEWVAMSAASAKIKDGILVVEGGGSGGGGASADLPIVVAKFESTDYGATYYSTTHTAEEIRGELLAGTPVIALATDLHLLSVVTCSCWTADTMVYVGVPMFDGGWQHDVTSADHYADGDVSNKTIGNELWVEY